MGLKQTIQLKFPIKSKDFSGSFSRVEKLTGVQYLLLTMISSNPSGALAWRDMLGVFGIPEEIYERVFKRALNQMQDRGIIETYRDFDIEEKVSKTEMTSLGKEAFGKMVITQDRPDEFGNCVSFLPARASDKYLKESDARKVLSLSDSTDADIKKYSDVEPDDIKIENYIQNNKKLFGIEDAEAEIFDLEIESKIKNSYYNENTRFEFDNITGSFSMASGNMDETFVKNRFDAKEIIGGMDQNIFISKSKDIDFVKWDTHIPDWDQFSFLLPTEIDFNKSKVVIVDAGSCRVNADGKKYWASAEEMGCDMMSVESGSVGSQYCLMSNDIKINGFDGSVSCNIAVRRSADKELINRAIKKLIANIDLETTADLENALFLAEIIQDKIAVSEIIETYLRSSKNIDAGIKTIQSLKGKTWDSVDSDIVETVLSERTDLSLDSIITVLSSNKIVLGGGALAASKKVGDASENIITADRIIPVSKNTEAVLTSLGVTDRIAEIILNGGGEALLSKPLAAAQNAYNNLTKLKNIFGMKSLSDYTFNYEFTDNENVKKEIQDCSSTFSKELTSLDKFIRSDSKYAGIKSYESFFKEVASYYGNNQPLEKAPPRNFGIGLGIELDNNLREITSPGTLDSMLKGALAEEKITKGDYEILDEFRIFRNECAHSKTLPGLCQNNKAFEKERRKWIGAVRRIKPSRAEEKK